MSLDSTTTGASARLNRSCEECRKRKIKCYIHESTGPADYREKRCTRCSNLALNCFFVPPAVRKKRKRNETRIKELEQKIEQIQATAVAETIVASREAHVQTPPGSSAGPEAYPLPLVDSRLSQELYTTFCNKLAPLYPLVFPPEPSTWQVTEKDRPAFFKAAITAASSTVNRALFEKLFYETSRYITDKVVLAGDKSLDLVQALLVLATWFNPPKRFQELNFDQYGNMAATMAIDLRTSNCPRYRIVLPEAHAEPTNESVENSRTFLACYFLSSSMAFSYRRPTALRYGPWVEDCIELLERVRCPHMNDRRLIALAKLQRIVEESYEITGLHESSPRFQLDRRNISILRNCLENVRNWRQSVADDIMNATVDIHHKMILISLHEPFLYDGHDIEDFRPPYKIRSHPLTRASPAEACIGINKYLLQCIVHAQELIRSFLDLEDPLLLTVPVIIYTRMMYAAIVLIKCCVSVRAALGTTQAEHKQILDPKTTLLRLINKLEPVRCRNGEQFSVPMVFQTALLAVSEWYDQNFGQRQTSSHRDIIEPMMHLCVDDTHSRASDLSEDSRSTAGHSRIVDLDPDAVDTSVSEGGSIDSVILETWPESSIQDSLLDFLELLDIIDVENSKI